MHRKLENLADQAFDLVVVGGGITGAFTAWDAALRGLRVALVERGDFGHATSAASSKVIHGGIRHLQQGAVGRVRESLVERRHFRYMAPHLVRPLPFLIPTYGHGLRGKEILAAGMCVYEALGFDQNRLADASRHLGRFRLLSKRAALAEEPHLPPAGLTGGVHYWEAHMHNSERMTLAVIRSAAAAGAVVANYVEVTGFLGDARRVRGVTVRDGHGGDTFEIQASMVANVTGPWARRLVDRALGRAPYSVALSKGVHLVTRSLSRSGAIALATQHQNEAVINRGGRHFFIIPWRGHSLIGTTNVPYEGDPGDVHVTAKDIDEFVAEIDAAYPAAGLKRQDVLHAFCGLYPLVDKDVAPGVYQGAGQYQVYDHATLDGVDALVTTIGAKYTTARNLARQTVDLIFEKLGREAPPCRTAQTRAWGGALERWDTFLADFLRRGEALAEPIGGEPPGSANADVLEELAQSYGSEATQLLDLALTDARYAERLAPGRETIGAAVVHAVREEMAQTLADVVFRRTGLGTLGHPGHDALARTAQLMAPELGWRDGTAQREIGEVERCFSIGARRTPLRRCG